MSAEEGVRTPSKGNKAGQSNASPSGSLRGSAKKPTKNAKITNFFTKVNSPLMRNNSNSNHEYSENDQQPLDELSKEASSSSMKISNDVSAVGTSKKIKGELGKDYVFIIPSSDDDTNTSTKGPTTRRQRAPSVQSNNSKSSDGFILTYANNELGLARKHHRNPQGIEKCEASSNHERPVTPSKGSTRDSRSCDSLPEKRMRMDAIANSVANSSQRINRIQPTMIGSRTKLIDFQSVPSDLNLPRDQAAKLIEKLFLVKMPEDFYFFWDFAKTINHRKPCSAFSHPNLGWSLVGPYDVLSGLIADFHGFDRKSLLTHCRYYYDPPEFQTVIVKRDSQWTHYGFWRDEPDQEKAIVIMNKAALNGQMHEVGDNLFTLLRSELDAAIGSLNKSSQDVPPLTSSSARTPRSKSSSSSSSNESSCNKQSQLEKAKAKQELTIIRDKLLDFCSSHENLSCESWSRTNTRRSKRCAKTLNTVGIVVPKDGDVGYRDLGVTDTKLKTMLTRISEFKDEKTKCSQHKELHQLINNANMANDECDFGMGLELGMDLFYQGDTYFHKDIEFLLTNAYTLLGRTEFLEILKSHLEDRKKSDKVSLLD